MPALTRAPDSDSGGRRDDWPASRLRIWLLAVGAAVGLMLLVSGTAMATVPGGNGMIAFVREGDIWLINEDGTGKRQLTTNPAPDASPAWSPDGTRVAFERVIDGRPQIFVIRLDGSRPVQLTTASLGSRDPAWSPDGSRIAFSRTRQSIGGDLFVMRFDGSAQVEIRDGDLYELRAPEWSPGGDWIYFGAISDNGGLSRVRPNGTDHQYLGGPPQLGSGSNWWDAPTASPDGEWLAFEQSLMEEGSGFVPGEQRLGKMRPNGSDVRMLPSYGAVLKEPSWSPSGSRIAFQTNLNGDNEIYTMDTTGGDLRRVTNNPADDTEPAWQPVRPQPSPSVTDLTPATVTAGTGARTITVSGTDFTPSSLVRVNGENRPTAFVNGSTLRATLTNVDVSAVGTLQVQVYTAGAPAGGTSGTLPLRVVPPASSPPLPAPPDNRIAPALSAQPRVGVPVGCSPGTWTGSPTTFSWRWLRGGEPLDGATAPSYTPVTADTGTSLACQVTAGNAGGRSVAISEVAIVEATGDTSDRPAPVVPVAAPLPVATPAAATPAPRSVVTRACTRARRLLAANTRQLRRAQMQVRTLRLKPARRVAQLRVKRLHQSRKRILVLQRRACIRR